MAPWAEGFLKGSTIHKRAIWPKPDDTRDEEGYACIVCGDFVPDGALNAEYDTHEIMHLLQAKMGLIPFPWVMLDDDSLPNGIRWEK